MKVFLYQLPNGKVIILRPVPASKRREVKMLCLLISGWIESLETEANPIAYLYQNNADGQSETIISFFKQFNLSYFELQSLKKSNLLEILAIIAGMDVDPTIVQDSTEGFILPSSGDSEADLLADLISIFDVQSGLKIYNTLDFVTIQLVLKRMQFQSRREELEERYNKNIAVSQLMKLYNSGAWDKIEWSDKPPI